jgi:hypothetical protein
LRQLALALRRYAQPHVAYWGAKVSMMALFSFLRGKSLPPPSLVESP